MFILLAGFFSCATALGYLTESRPHAQVVALNDAKSGVRVILVGCMHYNPSSIELASSIVHDLGASNSLKAVCLETCTQRWERTLRTQPQGSTLRSVLDNEMQAAQEAGMKFDVPIILADQNISVTNQRLKETLTQSVSDLASMRPNRIVDDILNVRDIVFPLDPSIPSLGWADFFDGSLLAAAPISFLRYPAALFIKKPLIGVLFVVISVISVNAGSTVVIDGGAPDAVAFDPLTARLVDVAITGLTVALETFLLARTFVVALLAERNLVLADSVRKACCMETPSQKGAVVAVLGAAHVSGVARLLRTS